MHLRIEPMTHFLTRRASLSVTALALLVSAGCVAIASGAQASNPAPDSWCATTIPVAPFILLSGASAIWVSFALAMGSHFLVGAMRSVFTGRGVIRSGMDMFVVGLGVAAVGYYVGEWIAKSL